MHRPAAFVRVYNSFWNRDSMIDSCTTDDATYASHASHMYVSLTVVCSISVSEFALLWHKTTYIKETLHRVATAPAVSSAIVRDDNVCVAVLLLLFSSPLHKWFYLSWYYIFIENSPLKYPSIKVGTLLSCVKNHNGITLPYQVT